jgi:hypothetical protein
MGVEDISADDFGMELPDGFDTRGIRLGVVAMEVIAIGESELDHAGFVEHPKKFSAGWADKGSIEAGFGFATGFANQKNRLHNFLAWLGRESLPAPVGF